MRPAMMAASLEMVVVEGPERGGDAGQVAQVALHGGHHGAGVEDVAADVGSGIDAGDDHVDVARGEVSDAVEDGVGGGAVDLEGVDAVESGSARVRSQGPVAGEGGGHS